MCGTSLDGLDLAYCSFRQTQGKWQFGCVHTDEIELPIELRTKLQNATNSTAQELAQLDIEVGHFFGKETNDFIEKNKIKPDYIASHGVTIFHQPDQGITLQIGSGAVIASETNVTTVCDFRSQDVAKGGQGAPLVPYPDQLLFSDFDATLNLGGFANLAVIQNESLSGFDVCVCNKALNDLTQQLNGSPFDANGDYSRKGSINQRFLDELNDLAFYIAPPPKSLGHEWYVEHILPLLAKPIPTEDKLRTMVEHIAQQIGNVLPKSGTTLVTGGGANNRYLIERIEKNISGNITIPDRQIVDFKEAIDFAFLGALRLQNLTNIKASVTGANSDSIAGCIYQP